jgi:hypothetical protein
MLPFVVYLTIPSLLVVLQVIVGLLHEKHAETGAHLGSSGLTKSTVIVSL